MTSRMTFPKVVERKQRDLSKRRNWAVPMVLLTGTHLLGIMGDEVAKAETMPYSARLAGSPESLFEINRHTVR
jgi:hypothetical protein